MIINFQNSNKQGKGLNKVQGSIFWPCSNKRPPVYLSGESSWNNNFRTSRGTLILKDFWGAAVSPVVVVVVVVVCCCCNVVVVVQGVVVAVDFLQHLS